MGDLNGPYGRPGARGHHVGDPRLSVYMRGRRKPQQMRRVFNLKSVFYRIIIKPGKRLLSMEVVTDTFLVLGKSQFCCVLFSLLYFKLIAIGLASELILDTVRASQQTANKNLSVHTG